MAAEFEEVIVAPDALNPEQLHPDLCQRRLDRALRRFRGGVRISLVGRRRQRLAAYKITLGEVADLSQGFDPDIWDSAWQEWDCAWRQIARIYKKIPRSPPRAS
ncbi:hypothetical protein [Mesorhizobium sp.]|uniref:hypothetical protein n=1 Tax=Mesorhizobium sp. TaxID=1871066 RepID=UPI0025C2B9A2|nr:hypothetical protein [Mesorhizobium sp.]